jgi:3-deoxy-7-phosphoheptulonate synthase
MTSKQIYNANILAEQLLPSPQQIKDELPLSPALEQRIISYREVLSNILERTDNRLFVVVGPCSIHDEEAALEYASRLKRLAAEVKDTMFLVMRVYFEKPRTVAGWKGFINDPFLDDSFQIEQGLKKSRKLLVELVEMGVPVGTEALDPVTPQYLNDLISWSAIGARTTESQTHRELASGLSTPVGFKNGTDGNIGVAINALKSVAFPHHFLGINRQGQIAVMSTAGNRYGHVVLRGGPQPNYDSVNIALAEKALLEANLPVNLMVDCSHGNSHKNPDLQPLVFEDCINQIVDGNRSIIGLMLESHLKGGRQDLNGGKEKLEYGVSITDGCIGWETTEQIILKASEKLKAMLNQRKR